MGETIGEFIEANTLIAGLISIVIGLVLLLFRIGKNNSLNFNKHKYISWQFFTRGWEVILILLIGGVILIAKSI